MEAASDRSIDPVEIELGDGSDPEDVDLPLIHLGHPDQRI